MTIRSFIEKCSISIKCRSQRFKIFLDMVKDNPRPVTILDIGGTQNYWELIGSGLSLNNEFQITLINIEKQSVSLPNYTSITGDGRIMHQFTDKQFDIV